MLRSAVNNNAYILAIVLQGDGYLCVSVYNGNIFVLIKRGGSAAVPLQSDELYLSDGRLHSVLLDFTLPTR